MTFDPSADVIFGLGGAAVALISAWAVLRNTVTELKTTVKTLTAAVGEVPLLKQEVENLKSSMRNLDNDLRDAASQLRRVELAMAASGIPLEVIETPTGRHRKAIVIPEGTAPRAHTPTPEGER